MKTMRKSTIFVGEINFGMCSGACRPRARGTTIADGRYTIYYTVHCVARCAPHVCPWQGVTSRTAVGLRNHDGFKIHMRNNSSYIYRFLPYFCRYIIYIILDKNVTNVYVWIITFWRNVSLKVFYWMVRWRDSPK